MRLHGLDSMNIRRIESGILNVGFDFHRGTTPFMAGPGKFVDLDKPDLMGKPTLVSVPGQNRLYGLIVPDAEPPTGGEIWTTTSIGKVAAGAVSPCLQTGIGIAPVA